MSLNKKELEDFVVDILFNGLDNKFLPKTSINLSSRLREDLDMDSMGSVSMLLDIEERLGVSFKNDELGALKTVGDLISIISTKMNAIPSNPL